VAAAIGLGPVTDAYMMALSVTRSLSKIFRVHTFQKIFVALFAQQTAQGTLAHLRQPISNLINVSIVLFAPLTLLMIVLAPYLVHVLAPGFPDPTRQMTVEMVRLLLSLILYNALAGLFVGILNSCERFMLASVSGLLPSAVVAIAAVVGLPRFGISALVWGNVLGSFVHLLLLYLGILRLGFRHLLVLDWRDRDLWTTAKLVAPFYVGGVALEGRHLVTIVLLSLLPAGRFSALVLATRITEYVGHYIFSPIMTVAYPSLVQKAGESRERMREHMIRVLRMFNFVAFPVLAWLVVFSEKIVQILFYRGQFQERDVNDVALALIILTIGLFPNGLDSVLGNAMFALRRTGWLNVFKVTSQFGVTALSLILFPFGIGGIAAANASATLLMVLMQALYVNRHVAIGNVVVDRASLRVLFLGLMGGAVAYGLQHLIGEPSSPTWWMQAAYIVFVSVPAVIAYLTLSRYFRIPEVGVFTAYLSGWLQAERWRPLMHWARALAPRVWRA
jgi:putative peptidoglycan lipid II flippase